MIPELIRIILRYLSPEDLLSLTGYPELSGYPDWLEVRRSRTGVSHSLPKKLRKFNVWSKDEMVRIIETEDVKKYANAILAKCSREVIEYLLSVVDIENTFNGNCAYWVIKRRIEKLYPIILKKRILPLILEDKNVDLLVLYLSSRKVSIDQVDDIFYHLYPTDYFQVIDFFSTKDIEYVMSKSYVDFSLVKDYFRDKNTKIFQIYYTMFNWAEYWDGSELNPSSALMLYINYIDPDILERLNSRLEKYHIIVEDETIEDEMIEDGVIVRIVEFPKIPFSDILIKTYREKPESRDLIIEARDFFLYENDIPGLIALVELYGHSFASGVLVGKNKKFYLEGIRLMNKIRSVFLEKIILYVFYNEISETEKKDLKSSLNVGHLYE